eukprot:TRINITY_DN57032_c0_g1_i1.p1 TRINITY_DN57032_c0_g1~~TRINITY_DN57032_c0_g1_i1.p1  ORF type:complete len:534 (+),score=70.21 TRINITY_DN57032_c0_g1_i1:39-1640(+)
MELSFTDADARFADDLNMLKRQRVGIYMAYLLDGFMESTCATFLYPFLTILHDEPNNYQAAVGGAFQIFVNFKILFGMWSDTFPIGGLRRKPYILLGWCIAITASVSLASVAQWSPQRTICRSVDNVVVSCTNVAAFTKLHFADVPLSSLVLSLTANNFGRVMAFTAAQSMAVELAKKESYETRGRLQSYCAAARYVGGTFAALFIGIALNGPLYGGSFDWELSIPAYTWILCAIQALGVPWWLWLQEQPVHVDIIVPVRMRLKQCADLLKNKAYSNLLLFAVIMNAAGGVQVAARNSCLASWVKMSPFFYSSDAVVQQLVLAATMYASGRYLKKFSWHRLYVYGELVYLFLMMLFWLVVFDVFRCPLFVMFIDADKTAAAYSAFMVLSWAAVEMAPKGLEGTTVALALNVGNAGWCFGGYLTRVYNGFFELSRDQIRMDDTHVHWQYIQNAMLVIVTQMAFFPFLCWVPTQKDDARRRFQLHQTSVLKGIAATVLAAFAVLWAVGSTVGGLFCSCAQIFGGTGCADGHCAKG